MVCKLFGTSSDAISSTSSWLYVVMVTLLDEKKTRKVVLLYAKLKGM